MKNNPKVAIIASGGGHTVYAEAVAETLKNKVNLLIVIPKGDNWTKAKMKKYGIIFETEKASPGSPLWKRIIAVLKGFLKGLLIPKSDVVIATGSNHSIGPAIALKLKGAKLVVIEAIDRIVTKSKAVNLLSKFANIVVLHWKDQKKNYPHGKVYGPILLKSKANARNKKYILITFGTQGFEKFFDYVAKMHDIAKKSVLQTGKVNPKKYVGKFKKTFSFDPHFTKWMSNASVILTHQGVTAAEAAIVYQKPTIIIFNHKLIGTSGYEDTKNLAQKIGAVFVGNYKRFSVKHIKKAKRIKKKTKLEFGTKKLVKDILQLLHM